MELFLAIIVYPVIVWRMKETNSYKGVFFAVLFTIIFMFFSKPLLNIIYNTNLGLNYIKVKNN